MSNVKIYDAVIQEYTASFLSQALHLYRDDIQKDILENVKKLGKKFDNDFVYFELDDDSDTAKFRSKIIKSKYSISDLEFFDKEIKRKLNE